MEKIISFDKRYKKDWCADIPHWNVQLADLQLVEGADRQLVGWQKLLMNFNY